jgi:hypothetical protein
LWEDIFMFLGKACEAISEKNLNWIPRYMMEWLMMWML